MERQLFVEVSSSSISHCLTPRPLLCAAPTAYVGALLISATSQAASHSDTGVAHMRATFILHHFLYRRTTANYTKIIIFLFYHHRQTSAEPGLMLFQFLFSLFVLLFLILFKESDKKSCFCCPCSRSSAPTPHSSIEQ